MRRLLAALVYTATVLSAGALTIEHNGIPVRSLSSAQIEASTYLIPRDGGLHRGLALDEILPLCSEIHRLVARSSDTTHTWSGDDLAEEMYRSYLLSAGAESWDLIFRGNRFADVQQLEIWGEAISSTSLEVWVSWEGVSLLRKEIARFADRHSVEIKVVQVPKTESKLLAVQRAGGPTADLVMIQSDSLNSLVRSRTIQNLDYLDMPGLAKKGRSAFLLNGSTWAAPFYSDCQLVFYRPTLVSPTPQMDWTLQDLERMASAVPRTGRQETYPMTWNAYSAYWLSAFLLGFGKEHLIEGDGSFRVDDDATRRALTYLVGLQRRGLLHIAERDAMISLFASGKVGIILSGSYSIPLFEDLAIDFAVAPYPQHEGHPLSPLLDFKGWAITRKSRNPILARRLLQHLEGIGVQQRFPAAVSKLPANTDCWPVVRDQNPHFAVLAHSSQIGTPIPPDPAYRAYKDTMWKILRLLFSGQLGVEEAITTGQSIIDNRMADMR